MKTLFIWLIIVLCLVGIGYAMHLDPGYVLVAYYHTTFQMTLWFAIVALLVVLLVLRIIWGLIAGVITMPAYFRKRRTRIAAVKSQEYLQKALLATVVGSYHEAAKAFKKGAKYQEQPLVNILGGAFALQYSGQEQSGEKLLTQALQDLPKEENAIYYMQAQLYVAKQYYAKALTALERMSEENQQENLWVMLAMQCYIPLSKWEKAYALLPRFDRIATIAKSEKESVLQSIIIGCISAYNMVALEKFWQSLPKIDRQKEAYVWLLADRYIENEAFSLAANVIMEQLKQESSEDLWELLSTCVQTETQLIAHFCQKQMRHHKEEWAIPYCAAMAALQEGDLNQAKTYLLQSIDIKPTEQALLVLANIYKQQNLQDDMKQACLQLLALSDE